MISSNERSASVEKAMEEMASLAEAFGKDYKPSEAEAKAAAEMAECMQKLLK